MAQPQLLDHSKFVDLTKNRMRSRPMSNRLVKKTIEKRYERLKTKRTPFLERAKRFSSYTVPNLYPDSTCYDQGDGVDTTGWQSFGAQCVNNIVNKLVMTLFPPHNSFARLELTPKAISVLKEDDINVIEQSSMLINAEKEALLEHERIAGRVGLGEALEHLCVGGSTCLYMPDKGNLINYPLDRFVNRRDKSGTLLELILEESKAIDTFDPALQAIIKVKLQEKRRKLNDEEDDEVKLFTRALLRNGFYEVEQEVLGEPVGQKYKVLPENLPFIVLRWKTNYGEDYGRSLVEQYANDLHFIQFLSEAMAKGMILMADIKYLIKRGSTIDVDHLISSPTGEFVYGDIDDVGVLQLEKYADFTPIATVLEKYERRVGNAFMLGAAIQRNAERVTAYEIRRDAIEMEQQLGGAYSLLANTLQRPYFKLLLNRIDFDLPPNIVSTVLLTGIEALSKMGDADKFMQWSEQMMAAAQLPPQVQERMKWGDFGQYVANQLSFDMPFMMDEKEYREYSKEKAAQQQQAMMQEGLMNSMPQAINNMTKQ